MPPRNCTGAATAPPFFRILRRKAPFQGDFNRNGTCAPKNFPLEKSEKIFLWRFSHKGKISKKKFGNAVLPFGTLESRTAPHGHSPFLRGCSIAFSLKTFFPINRHPPRRFSSVSLSYLPDHLPIGFACTVPPPCRAPRPSVPKRRKPAVWINKKCPAERSARRFRHLGANLGADH